MELRDRGRRATRAIDDSRDRRLARSTTRAIDDTPAIDMGGATVARADASTPVVGGLG
ncbi:hypothetical protein [Luethyella okanaganae]|uniref:Uncharacterized protein n=1 Tax=Luethyella okanaganae TaxID=69372 RepID=A0ABW1VFI6_9MICO